MHAIVHSFEREARTGLRCQSYICSMHYARWLVNHGEPEGQEPITPVRAAVVRSDLYDGSTITLPVLAVAKAPGWVCVQQTVDPSRQWLAWIPADRVRPR